MLTVKRLFHEPGRVKGLHPALQWDFENHPKLVHDLARMISVHSSFLIGDKVEVTMSSYTKQHIQKPGILLLDLSGCLYHIYYESTISKRDRERVGIDILKVHNPDKSAIIALSNAYESPQVYLFPRSIRELSAFFSAMVQQASSPTRLKLKKPSELQFSCPNSKLSKTPGVLHQILCISLIDIRRKLV